MTARNKNKNTIIPQGLATVRNSTVATGLPTLTGNLRKKPVATNQDAWLTNGTKFERIEGF
jgi:hypothetical protein